MGSRCSAGGEGPPPADCSRAGCRLRRSCGDGGSAPIEEVLVLPALLLLLLAGMQFAIFGLAAHAASFAISEGAAEVRSSGGSLQLGEQLVVSDVKAIAPELLVTPRVSTTATAGRPTALVLHANVPTIFPGLKLSVAAVSAGLAQEFRPG